MKSSLNMLTFLGKFHPLLVHVPIGALLVAWCFHLAGRRDTWRELRRAIPFTLGIGFVAALGAVTTGLLLYRSGEYGGPTVLRHLWLGIGLCLGMGLVAWQYRRIPPGTGRFLTWGGLLILLMATGHLGGSLTHGSDYLRPDFGADQDLSQIDLAQAAWYPDLVAPILQDKCAACHSEKKQKGKLRLDSPEYIQRGGKNGQVLGAEGLLDQRIHLPLSDEEHMPPEGRPQLSPAELRTLELWLTEGAPFSDTTLAPGTQRELRRIWSQPIKKQVEKIPLFPTGPGKPADPEAVAALQEIGMAVVPIGEKSNYLSVNLLGKPEWTAEDWSLLLPLADQLVDLKAGQTKPGREALSILSQLKALRRLDLSQNELAGEMLTQLEDLSQLRHLNLAGNQIQIAQLRDWSLLDQLEVLYLYDNPLTDQHRLALQAAHPQLRIEGTDLAAAFIQHLSRVDSLPE